MFKSKRNNIDIGDAMQCPEDNVISGQADVPEWEEVTDAPEEKNTFASRMNSGYVAVDGDNDVFNISAFPAIRMARGIEERKHSDSEMNMGEHFGSDEEQRSALIRRYADMDDENEMIAAGYADLPELFRQEPEKPMDSAAEETGAEDASETQEEEAEEEFTMEAELERQQIISGELFDFIDCIVNNTEQTSVMREKMRCGTAKEIVVDPYNAAFNDQYNDREEILSTTAEISLAPKYQMEEQGVFSEISADDTKNFNLTDFE